MKEKSLPYDIVVSMLDWIINDQVRQSPYITIVSKKQLWFGNGKWKGCPDSDLKKGLRSSLGIRIPTDVEIEKKNFFYGYPALQKPWSYLNNITNHAVRRGILWKVIDGKEYSDIRPIIGKGYVREDGTLDPNQTTGQSCYIFFYADPIFRDSQNDWIKRQKDWVQLQILRNQMTHREVLSEKQKQASTLVKNNKKLLQLMEYKELEVPIDREKITWETSEED